MSGQYFVDSNVLIYLHEGGDKAAKAAALVAELLDSHGLIVSPQVIAEVFVNVERAFGRDAARDQAADLVQIASVQPLDSQTTRAALATADRYGLSYWDAQICASAAASGARVLLSEDLQDGQALNGVTVRNPFTSDFSLT